MNQKVVDFDEVVKVLIEKERYVKSLESELQALRTQAAYDNEALTRMQEAGVRLEAGV